MDGDTPGQLPPRIKSPLHGPVTVMAPRSMSTMLVFVNVTILTGPEVPTVTELKSRAAGVSIPFAGNSQAYPIHPGLQLHPLLSHVPWELQGESSVNLNPTPLSSYEIPATNPSFTG